MAQMNGDEHVTYLESLYHKLDLVQQFNIPEVLRCRLRLRAVLRRSVTSSMCLVLVALGAHTLSLTPDAVVRATHCTVLYCTVLYCTVLYCTVLYCTVLYCTVLYCGAYSSRV